MNAAGRERAQQCALAPPCFFLIAHKVPRLPGTSFTYQMRKLPGLLDLPQVKFTQPLLPGEAAEIHVESPAPGRWRFRVSRENALLASGEIRAR